MTTGRINQGTVHSGPISYPGPLGHRGFGSLSFSLSFFLRRVGRPTLDQHQLVLGDAGTRLQSVMVRVVSSRPDSWRVDCK